MQEGLARITAFDPLSARELLSRAVAADPSFPLAHSELARTWSSLGYDANAQREAEKALDGAGHLSREKHLLVEARFVGHHQSRKLCAIGHSADLRFVP